MSPLLAVRTRPKMVGVAFGVGRMPEAVTHAVPLKILRTPGLTL